MDKNSLQALLGQGLSVAKIAERFGKDPSTVSYWMAKHGLEAVNREKHAARGGIERERLAELVEAGMTIAEIAEIWGAAKDAGRVTVTMSCARRGESEFFLEGSGYYRCKRCRSEAVARRRRKVKAILVREAGGRCRVCGYDRFPGALEFHHSDPLKKRMPVSADGNGYSLDTLREEAKKCVLLCANCHAEIENGVAAVPIE